MTTIFLSATYDDLIDHRRAVIDTLTRMGHRPVTMEDFGARDSTPWEACEREIRKAGLFIGIYAWRYGSSPPGRDVSYTEAEFDAAEAAGLPMLLYQVDANHPWPPCHIDPDRAAIERFRRDKVARRLTKRFTTANDLASQVAADIARHLEQHRRPETAGGLLTLNWELFSPELREVLLAAEARARGKETGVIATRDVIAALVAAPNSAGMLLNAMPREALPEPSPAKPSDPAGAFTHEGPFSHCVTRSIRSLTENRSPERPILAVELAADLLINGRGSSVAKFRQAGIDADVVNAMMRRAKAVAAEPARLRAALAAFDRSELDVIGYSLGLAVGEDAFRADPVGRLIEAAEGSDRVATLLGEMLRRRPNLLETAA